MNDMKTTHDAIDALLPWYVNGTLGDTDRLRVDAHLVECSDCRHSIAFLERLEARLLRIEPAADSARLPDSLRRQVESSDDQAVETRNRYGRLAASIVLAFSLGIGGGLLVSEQAVYRTATATEAGTAGDSEILRVRVHFTDETRMTDFGNFLRDHDGVISAGPARDGWYELELPKPAGLEADAFINQLKNSAGVDAIHQVNASDPMTHEAE